MFRSGVAIGSGLTYQLDKKHVSLTINGVFGPETVQITLCDTPGLNDAGKRVEAGKAISKALKVRNFTYLGLREA